MGTVSAWGLFVVTDVVGWGASGPACPAATPWSGWPRNDCGWRAVGLSSC